MCACMCVEIIYEFFPPFDAACYMLTRSQDESLNLLKTTVLLQRPQCSLYCHHLLTDSASFVQKFVTNVKDVVLLLLWWDLYFCSREN